MDLATPSEKLCLFLGGDVMLGRGIDQILPFPVKPRIHEEYLHSALDYLRLAEQRNGPLSYPVDFSYVWGDALAELEKRSPQARLINLETSITTSEDWEDKGINYRLSPRNAAVLKALKVDVCALANNHILDWGERGLIESLETLRSLGIRSAGAGLNLSEAAAPAVLEVRGGRLLVFAMAAPSSGVPLAWAAGPQKPGVHLLEDLSLKTLTRVQRLITSWRRPGDRVVVSIHWGGNWGYPLPKEHPFFARKLVTEAGVDLIHGHSSHHLLGLEVHQGKLIIYGCGDFLNDYEGIRGYEAYRADLPVMFFPNLDLRNGTLTDLVLVPMQIKKFRLQRAGAEDRLWLQNLLAREDRGARLGPRTPWTIES